MSVCVWIAAEINQCLTYEERMYVGQMYVGRIYEGRMYEGRMY